MTITMPELHVGRGMSCGPLTIFPVWTGAAAPTGLVTAKLAHVNVAEREDGPAVDQVVLTNVGYQMALLLEGELLEGGWQQRVLRNDVVLAPGISMEAAAVCVEAGRWEGLTSLRRQARRASVSVRAALDASLPGTLQDEVWQRVARYDVVVGASPTGSLVDHLDRLDHLPLVFGDGDTAMLLGEIRQLHPLPGQRGVIVGVAGHPVLVELFASRSALAAHMQQLLTGLLLDAITAGTSPKPTPSRNARRFIQWLDGVPAIPQPDLNAGAGVPLAAESPDFVAHGVSLAGRWAHLTALNRRHSLLGIS
jgi:hypothetical protein